MTTAIDALLIEENPTDAQLFRRLINASRSSPSRIHPLTVHHSKRFREAIIALKTTPFDVVVLNLSSADGNGIRLLQQLRSHAPQLPVVAINSVIDQRMAVAALKAGAQDYLVKPEVFAPERLQKLGYADAGNLLVKTIAYAIQRAELTKQLAISKERYQLAVQGANDGIWDWDLHQQTIYYSERWCSMLGLSSANVGNSPEAWLSRIHPVDLIQFQQQLQAHLARRSGQFQCEYRLRHSDGSYRWMLSRGTSLWDEQGIAYRIAGSQTDITARKSLERSLHQEKELAQITLHSIGDAIITTDREGYIEDFNPVAERLTGWQRSEAKHRLITEVCTLIEGTSRTPLSNPAMRVIEEGCAIRLSHQSTLISKTGEEFAISDSAAPIRSKDGDIIGTVLVLRDVSEQRSQTKELAWQASHDPLTQLCNRVSFMRSLTQAIKDTQQPRPQHVLCYLDLDHFKIVNDTHGHVAGDQLLKQVADLWRSRIRASDILARVGGDEFGLLLYDCDIKRAKRIAQDFCDSIETFQFSYGEHIFKIGVSIGVVLVSDEMTSAEDVLSFADQACYLAKERGRNRVAIYASKAQATTASPNVRQWQALLNNAIENDQFRLFQQRIVSTATGAVQHTEVLLRLHTAQSEKPMPPMGFIPTAERYHLMPQIDRWVVQKVIQHIARSLPSDAQPMVYSINLSASSVYDESFLGYLQQQLAIYQVEASHLCFEITETVAIANLQKSARFTAALQQIGTQVTIDDFGNSLSALTYFKDLSVNILKISGRFVREAATDAITRTMLAAIHQVAQVMNIQTVAKSVENPAILAAVTDVGIHCAQGYQVAPIQPLLSGSDYLTADYDGADYQKADYSKADCPKAESPAAPQAKLTPTVAAYA